MHLGPLVGVEGLVRLLHGVQNEGVDILGFLSGLLSFLATMYFVFDAGLVSLRLLLRLASLNSTAIVYFILAGEIRKSIWSLQWFILTQC